MKATRTLLGFDIGGTKSAAILGESAGDTVRILDRESFPTAPEPQTVLHQLAETAQAMLSELNLSPDAVGISCGGPLDSRRGLVLSPPNLPAWDAIPVTQFFAKTFGVPAFLQNDANACALAEWRWGAGRGTSNMVFLTFGTGMGAGLILDGKLYSGTNDNAGEVGHIRMAEDGPTGYGKAGSFEGFCSGGGIVRLAHMNGFTAESAHQVFNAAAAGDAAALQSIKAAATQLGRGLALLIDLLNPERIVIGSIFARQREALWPIAGEVLRAEALTLAQSVCMVVPAKLGEQVGDYAALSVATLAFQKSS
ncbi:MAG: ROK family protein [Verrucomicrobiota bacterium JB024]|nr:ROK family protein [Verrucomicrobiota bacterium JB024]